VKKIGRLHHYWRGTGRIDGSALSRSIPARSIGHTRWLGPRRAHSAHAQCARLSGRNQRHGIARADGRACADLWARLHEGRVTGLTRIADGFRVTLEDGRNFDARTVILATGILLNQVDLPHDVHEQAIEDDVLRYCAVCDAYEHIDRKIGVVGCEESGAGQALFLSRYSDRVTLYPDDPQAMDPADRAKLEANGVSISAMPMARVEPTRVAMEVWAKDGASPTAFDVIYPCFGTRPRTELARQLGLTVDEGGCLDSGAHFETSIPGFFAAGDIVRGLDQISVAMGHGATAATNVHSRLRKLDGEL
jgi:thioredoxin reductase (NADPH)